MREVMVSCPCGAMAEDPERVTPKGWFLLVQMESDGCWEDDDEMHFCSLECVRAHA